MIGFPNRTVSVSPSNFGPDHAATSRFAHKAAYAVLLATATAVALLAGLAGAAAQVPGPQWSGQNEVGGTKADGTCCANITDPITGPGSYPNATTSALGGTASSTVVTQGTPFPSLSVSSQTSGTSKQDTVFGDSNAQLNYYIEVLGPGPTVTLDLQGSAALTWSSPDLETATTSSIQLILRDEAINNVVAGVSYGSGGALPIYGTDYGSGVQAGFDPASFQLDTSLTIPTSSVMEVQMVAAAQAFSAGGEGGQSASAYLDPYFFVDPGTPNADQYSILVSEGIGNAPAIPGTPEPSTWAMILVGFAGMGFFARRTSRQKLAVRA